MSSTFFSDITLKSLVERSSVIFVAEPIDDQPEVEKLNFTITEAEFVIGTAQGETLVAVSRDKTKEKDLKKQYDFEPQRKVQRFKVLETVKGPGPKSQTVKVLEVNWKDSLAIGLMMTYLNEWYSPIFDSYKSETQQKVAKRSSRLLFLNPVAKENPYFTQASQNAFENVSLKSEVLKIVKHENEMED